MKVVTILKNLGCKVISRETTDGAQKWWLTYCTALNITVARRVVLAELRLCCCTGCITEPEPTHKGFEISFQTEEEDGFRGIFIAKPRKTAAGRNWQRGLDT